MNDKICPFCDADTLEKQYITDNEYAIALLPRRPISTGHILIIPKRHVQLITNLSLNEFGCIQKLINDLFDVFKIYSNAMGFNITNNNGKIAGQHIPHFHFHIFFRSRNEKISPFDILSKKVSPQEYSEIEWEKRLSTLKSLLLETKNS